MLGLAGNFRRFDRRFVIAGAPIALAAAALASLAWAPDDAVSRDRAKAPAPVARGPAAREQPAPRRAPDPGVRPAPPPPLPSRLTIPGGTGPNPGATIISPGQPALPSVAPGTLERELGSARDLLERLRILDRALNSVNSDQVLAAIEGLLEHTPGDADEARTLRIALFNRLGVLKSFPRAEARLLSTACDAGAARNERLVAIESLRRDGKLSPAARTQLAQLARASADEAVRARATWALGN